MTLDELCARGPWTVTVDDPTRACERVTTQLTGDDIRALYALIAAGSEVPNRSGRRTDRALRLLRRAGLIRFAGGRWEVARG